MECSSPWSGLKWIPGGWDWALFKHPIRSLCVRYTCGGGRGYFEITFLFSNIAAGRRHSTSDGSCSLFFFSFYPPLKKSLLLAFSLSSITFEKERINRQTNSLIVPTEMAVDGQDWTCFSFVVGWNKKKNSSRIFCDEKSTKIDRGFVCV